MVPSGYSAFDSVYMSRFSARRLMRVADHGDLRKFIFAYLDLDGRVTEFGFAGTADLHNRDRIRYSDWFWRFIMAYDKTVNGVIYQEVKDYGDIDLDVLSAVRQSKQIGQYITVQ